MSEKLHTKQGMENATSAEVARERIELLEKKHEAQTTTETHAEKNERIHEARKTVEIQASSRHEVAPLFEKQNEHQTVPSFITRRDRLNLFRTTLTHLQQRMPKAQRRFSQVIHNPTVERVSEVAEKTIARPSVVLGASIVGFFGLVTLYLVSRRVGFTLSGFEFPLLLLIGATAGLGLEFISKFLRRMAGQK